MYFVIRNKRYINAAGESFRFSSKASCRNCRAKSRRSRTGKTICRRFSSRGLTGSSEMRGADMGDRDHVIVLAAIWVGCSTMPMCSTPPWQLVRDWTDAEREALRMAFRVRRSPRRSAKVRFSMSREKSWFWPVPVWPAVALAKRPISPCLNIRWLQARRRRSVGPISTNGEWAGSEPYLRRRRDASV